MIPTIRKYEAGDAAIAPYTAVKLNDDGKVVVATAKTDNIFGVTTEVQTPANGSCDVVVCGITFARAGADVKAGNFLTIDNQGRVVPVAAEPTAKNRIVGQALYAMDYDDTNGLEDDERGEVAEIIVKPSII